MSTALDIRMRATSNRIINKFGTDIIIVKRSFGSWDNVKNEYVTGGLDDIAFEVKATPPVFFPLSEIDEQHILREDLQTTIAAHHETLSIQEFREIIPPETAQFRELTNEEVRIISAELQSSGDGSTILPEPDVDKDFVMFKDEIFKIINVQTVYSGDDIVTYNLQIRK